MIYDKVFLKVLFIKRWWKQVRASVRALAVRARVTWSFLDAGASGGRGQHANCLWAQDNPLDSKEKSAPAAAWWAWRPSHWATRKRRATRQYLHAASKIQDWCADLWNSNSLMAQTCDRHGEGCAGGKDWAFGVSRCRRWHPGWRNSEVLLCSSGSCSQF